MQLFKIVCRGSRLSQAQVGIFKEKLMTIHANVRVEIIIKETAGDANQLQPLTELEGKDFFTKDIQDCLLSGEADFAVHSLKDVSGENFFKENSYAIIEREDTHDAAIFNDNVIDKIRRGEIIRLGTSSPRRVEMAKGFLLKALPIFNTKQPNIETLPIRGNVDTRLRKLEAAEYDGVILACAGLNRLLREESAREEVSLLLQKKLLMILPLLACPPAPGQGAIVVETAPVNEEAIKILRLLNVEQLAIAVSKERKMAHKYGSGCHQKFGAIHINTGYSSFTYAAGKDRNDIDFMETDPTNTVLKGDRIISDTEIRNLSVEHNIDLINTIKRNIEGVSQFQKQWVSKTELWFELAQRGVWVEGSCEGFGLRFMEETISSPLVKCINTKSGT